MPPISALVFDRGKPTNRKGIYAGLDAFPVHLAQWSSLTLLMVIFPFFSTVVKQTELENNQELE
jgi:hypothetical protein